MAIDLHAWRAKLGFTQAEAVPAAGYGHWKTQGGRRLRGQEGRACRNERAGLSRLPACARILPPCGSGSPASARVASAGSGRPGLRGLPWVARQYAAKVEWEWLVQQAKLHDFQNRLGFLLELAGTGTKPMLQAKSELEAARLRYRSEMRPYPSGPTPTWHDTTLEMWVNVCWPGE